MRHGSAFPGGAGETMVKKNVNTSTGLVQCTYPVYVDGWGRQIYYWPADLAVSSTVRTRRAGDGATPVAFVLPQCPKRDSALPVPDPRPDQVLHAGDLHLHRPCHKRAVHSAN